MCGSSARTDLYGGQLAIAVPTVTELTPIAPLFRFVGGCFVCPASFPHPSASFASLSRILPHPPASCILIGANLVIALLVGVALWLFSKWRAHHHDRPPILCSSSQLGSEPS